MPTTDPRPLDDRYSSDDSRGREADAAISDALWGGFEPRPQVAEAYENLRVIREVMERSTKHSSLSGWSGVAVGLLALVGVALTRAVVLPERAHEGAMAFWVSLGATWTAVLASAVATDFIATKSRAARVGKHVFSKLGAHMVGAALPGCAAGMALTLCCVQRGDAGAVWSYWMLCYGLAICSVAQFSVRPVSYLGWAFLLTGAAALFLPHGLGLILLGASFGGYHILYGIYTGLSRRDW